MHRLVRIFVMRLKSDLDLIFASGAQYNSIHSHTQTHSRTHNTGNYLENLSPRQNAFKVTLQGVFSEIRNSSRLTSQGRFFLAGCWCLFPVTSVLRVEEEAGADAGLGAVLGADRTTGWGQATDGVEVLLGVAAAAAAAATGDPLAAGVVGAAGAAGVADAGGA